MIIRRLQKAAPPAGQSEAQIAYLALQGKIDEIRGLQREITREIVALEASGASPEPPSLPDEYSTVDHDLINGAAYAGAAMPPSNDANIQLYRKFRRSEQLKLTMAEAERQCFDAQVVLSGELLAVFDSEIRTLHAERANAILKIFEINRDLENMRTKILQSGGIVGHPLDGWSAKFFGTASPPSVANDAALRYIRQCIASGVLDIDPKEIQ